MAVNYKKLFHLMIERGISSPQLQKSCGFSGNILTRLRRNEYVSLETLERICVNMNCSLDDILEFTEEKRNIV